MPVFGQPGASTVQFSGKRITRGNYRLKDGTVIHADINAAGNTLRKVYPNYQIPRETFDKVEGFVFKTRIPKPPKPVKRMNDVLIRKVFAQPQFIAAVLSAIGVVQLGGM